MKITLDQACEILTTLKGGEFYGLEIETIPEMNKTDNPFINDGIHKICHMNVQITDYEASVNRDLAKNDEPADFKAQPNYHEPLILNGKLTAFARHKVTGQIYLRYRSLQCTKVEYINRYNVAVPEPLLRSFLPEKKEKKHNVCFRLTKLDNIRTLTIRGREYQIQKD